MSENPFIRIGVIIGLIIGVYIGLSKEALLQLGLSVVRNLQIKSLLLLLLLLYKIDLIFVCLFVL